jgi:sugar phosphate permease
MRTLRLHQAGVVCLLFGGYAALYFCRADLSVGTPLLVEDLAKHGVSHDAAGLSAIFPAVGAVSVLIAGWLSDRLGSRGRSLLLLVGFTATAGMLLLLTLIPLTASSGSPLALILIGTVAFCLLGPYSYLGGAMALDFGGKRGGAISSGIIDGVGYLGGVLAGDSVARMSVMFGWKGVFLALGAISALAALGAGYLHFLGNTTRIRASLSHE